MPSPIPPALSSHLAPSNLVPNALMHLSSIENPLNISPPRSLGATLGTLDQALLHAIGHLPPLLYSLVLAHALHVVCKSVSDVDEGGEEEVSFWVVEDVVWDLLALVPRPI